MALSRVTRHHSQPAYALAHDLFPRPEPAGFFTLLLIALMMASNHIAARVAFDSGLDVATAVATRSLVTASVVAFLLVVAHVSGALTANKAAACCLWA